jgi:hypothetical protein
MKLTLQQQRDRLKPRYERAKKSHKAREEIFARMQVLVLKDLRRSIRDRRKGRAA